MIGWRKPFEELTTTLCLLRAMEEPPERDIKGRFIKGHTGLIKENNPKWKGGRLKTSTGYIIVRCEGHPRTSEGHPYVFEHILVMEAYLGRYLTINEIIHHINGRKDDNRIENLELIDRSKHMKHHIQDIINNDRFKEAWKKRNRNSLGRFS